MVIYFVDLSNLLPKNSGFEWVFKQRIQKIGTPLFALKPFGKPPIRLYRNFWLENVRQEAEEIDIGDHWMGEDT